MGGILIKIRLESLTPWSRVLGALWQTARHGYSAVMPERRRACKNGLQDVAGSDSPRMWVAGER